MCALGSLSPFLQDEYQFVSFTFFLPVSNHLVVGGPHPPWTPCPFFSTSTPEETGSGAAIRASLLERGADL
jgi:hypothetical protein